MPATPPTYYYAPRPSPYVERQAPAYAPPITWYDDPVPPGPRYVRPAPPVPPEEPKQAELVPIAPRSPQPPPAFERADPCVGWWRLCHLYE